MIPIEELGKYYLNLDILSYNELSARKESDTLSIICPGRGVTNKLKEIDHLGDAFGLGVAGLMDIDFKFLWLEPKDRNFFEWEKEFTDSKHGNADSLYYLLSKMVYELSLKKLRGESNCELLLTPKVGYPVPPANINPKILKAWGSNWKDVKTVKRICRTYFEYGHNKDKILNLRASLVRCLSLGINLRYKKINILGVEPEKVSYFFNNQKERGVINNKLRSKIESDMDDYVRFETNMLKWDIHGTEISRKVSTLECVEISLCEYIRHGVPIPKINYIGDSEMWNGSDILNQLR